MTAEKIFDILKPYRADMESVLDYMENHPATGYREWDASNYLAELYKKLGYKLHMAENIPGFYTDIDTGKNGPKILVFCELDGLIVPTHPHADSITGAAHACGHHAQCAALYGVAAALKNSDMLEKLSGSIRLCVVPAEEIIELGFRKELIEKGTIRMLGGKQEFLTRGYFDGCDMAFMIHTGGGKHRFTIKPGCNGCIIKKVRFTGKAAHAAAPRLGVNALQAATLAMTAVNSLRDTFNNYDFVRVHPILTEAGAVVNAVPDVAVMENQVRANKVAVCADINRRVNLAVAASAAAIGAKALLCDMPGYMPGTYDKTLTEVMLSGMSEIVGEENAKFVSEPFDTGCTDMGDISQVMPAVHAFGSGGAGAAHGPKYHIADFESACMDSAAAQLMIIYRLLENNAQRAYDVIKNSNVHFKSKEEYLSFTESIFTEHEAVIYEDDGSIRLIG